MEALKSLYGTARKSEVDMSKKRDGGGNNKRKIVMPPFPEITKYIYTEAEQRVKDPAKRFTFGNHVLPFTVPVYVEVSNTEVRAYSAE